MPYVIYQYGYVVFGFGYTKKTAIEDAQGWTDINEEDLVEPYEANFGDMVIREITKEDLKKLQESDDPATCFPWENNNN